MLVSDSVRVLERDRVADELRHDEGGTTISYAGIVTALLVVCGSLVRLLYVLSADFPLNDGGFFFTIVRDIEHANFTLPAVTTYNATQIPLVYPPLAFYLAAAIDWLTPWDLPSIFRFLPLVLSILGILAFARLSRSLLGSGASSVAAVGAFAMLPMSFLWNIMGGGLTRSLGLLFLLLYFDQLILTYRYGLWRHIVLATIFATGTLLSHPEAALCAVYTTGIFFLWFGRSRNGVANSCLVAIGTAALTAPWWLSILARHGTAVLRAFGDSGFPWYEGIGHLLAYKVTSEPLFPWLGLLSILGLLGCMSRREWLLPLWLAATFVLQSRAGEQKAIIPLALLCGVGFAQVVVPLLHASASAVSGLTAREGYNSRLPFYVSCILVMLVTFSSMAGFHSVLNGLLPEDRQAINWVANNTPTSSKVIVLTSASWFGEDRISEWFPTLSQRQSVTTVQGHEWLGHFSSRVDRYKDAQRCFSQGPACLDQWAQKSGVAFDYVYIAKEGAGVTRARSAEFAQDARYSQVFDNEVATVYRISGSH